MKTMTDLPTILVVDDTPTNIDILCDVLKADYRIRVALNGHKALSLTRQHPLPDMILLDVMMPEIDGYEVCRQLKADPSTRDIPVIFITAMSDTNDEQMGFALGAVDYITKPISAPIVKARVKTHLALNFQNRELERKVRERTDELERNRLEIIQRLGRAAEFRDNETGLHVIRMSHYARLLAEHLGISASWSDLLFNAAPMHDVGKIGIADKILLKPGRLSEEEWVLMKNHPGIGAEIIGDNPAELMRLSREIALAHHEKWDGSGYPQNLRGLDIPLSARIVAVADVFDALTTARPYKSAWPVERAVSFIDDNSGSHFEPAVVQTFHRALTEILRIKDLYAESELDIGEKVIL